MSAIPSEGGRDGARERSGAGMTRRGFLWAGGVLLAGTGCQLRRASLPQRTFLLRAPVAPAAVGEPAGVLLVRPVRVAPAFDARGFVIRRGPDEFTADAYHAFLLSPGSMFTEALAAWTRGLGVFREVTTGGSPVVPSHALEAELTELYGDYRDVARAQAVLAMDLKLLHPLVGPGAPVVWRRSERRVVPLARAGAEELVAGWNEALAAVCRALDAALFQRPAGRLAPQAGRVTGLASPGYRV